MTNFSPVRKATAKLAERYITILKEYTTSWEAQDNAVPTMLYRVTAMCEIIANKDVDMYDDKASRWLGFVQGIMFIHGLIDIDEERDISRPLFYEAYEEMELSKPDIMDLKDW